jgi:pimeloyl-ACP methyl ester carboxylesterase
VAGLTGLVGASTAERLVTEVADGWRLTLDPAAFGVGAPDAAGLLAAARCPVVLARGDSDPMVSADQLAALAPGAVDVPGAGHNAHVEDPAAVASLLAPFDPVRRPLLGPRSVSMTAPPGRTAPRTC